MSVPGGSIVTMGRVHVSGYYRNGRWVSSYTQNRRSGIGESTWTGRSPLAIAAGLALVAALAVGGVFLIRELVHQLTYDPVRDPAPLAGSSRFQTAGVLCEGTAGQTPLVRCQLTGGMRLEPRAADPLCERPMYLAHLANGTTSEYPIASSSYGQYGAGNAVPIHGTLATMSPVSHRTVTRSQRN